MSQVHTTTSKLSLGEATPVVSAKPNVLPAPGRGEDLQVRVSAPATGRELPIIVFSHGFGWSMDGDAPLVDFWAAHGFVVVQPTHLDSRTLNLHQRIPARRSSGASGSRIWCARLTSSTGSKPRCRASRDASTPAASLSLGTPGGRPLPARCSARER